MSQESIVGTKSKSFAVRIVKLYQYLTENNEFVMSKQILRSGTSIGANITEARYAQSRADFISKMNIALKEAAETEYWLELLHSTNYTTDIQYQSMQADCSEIIKMLIAIVRTSKSN